ncbi:MAG: glycoside hydrolase family 92 protein [Chitinophagaceae bacterium]|nr:MAG: glycoside hydrolase family 92 protein [Chitinophagaceae bacterium]
MTNVRLSLVKKITAGLLLLASASHAQEKLSKYVNPFIGASTSEGDAGVYHGLGKTFPGAATPFGLVQVSPNTITGGDNGNGFSYEHTSIEGFALTQMSGVGWFGDLGNFLVMPTTGPLHTSRGKSGTSADGYRSAYDPATSVATAGYYQATLKDYSVKAELTAAPHAGMMRFTFPASQLSRIQVDLARRVGGTSVLQQVSQVGNNTITGFMKCTPEGGGWGDGDGKADYTVYFYAVFSKPFTSTGVWSAAIPDSANRHRDNVLSDHYQAWVREATVERNIKNKEGKHLGFFSEFETKEGEQVTLKVGISFTSAEGAKLNLQQDIPGWDFDRQRTLAAALWDKALGKMRVTGGTEEEKKVFYTALYHTMIDPRSMQDVNNNYIGADGKIHKGSSFTKRTVFSGWDVFRSQMPLQTIINPSVVNDIINSLVEMGDQSGKHYLERWELLNAYTGCMIGNPAIPVIADAYVKGIRRFNVPKAFEYSVNSVEKFGNGERGFSTGLGISHTLEYAFTENCVGDLAKWLGKDELAIKYHRRGQSYRNIFDSTHGWFRPRKEDGSWEDWPAEGRLKQWYGSIESNPLQQGWFVPHDVPGMVSIMGGNEKVIADLTEMFEKTPDNMMWNDYYNHANEPVHHVPFLFNRIGAPWLTQKWTRKITANAYHDGVNGLVGNEDVGQMSAWYVLAATGIHPVAPGNPRYEITSPVFSSITIKLDPAYAKGKTFTVVARDNKPGNIYIRSARLNGKPYNKCYIDHADIARGGVLELQMGNQPNKDWGSTK